MCELVVSVAEKGCFADVEWASYVEPAEVAAGGDRATVFAGVEVVAVAAVRGGLTIVDGRVVVAIGRGSGLYQ